MTAKSTKYDGKKHYFLPSMTVFSAKYDENNSPTIVPKESIVLNLSGQPIRVNPQEARNSL